MPLIKWAEAYSIGNKKLDDQHKKWIEIYNKAHDRMIDPNEKDFHSTGIDALREMKSYGKYHFSCEEDYMESMGFAKLDRHRKLHQAFMEEIEGMIDDLEKGNYILNSEVIKRIENWLLHHILNEDQVIRTLKK